ncbi:MAG: hypothetical protein NVS4B9_16260 [Ktedonobacteraceae bacterium]
MPIIDTIAGNTSLKDKIRIAPNWIERVVLYGTQVLKDARDICVREMIVREKKPCLFSQKVYRHEQISYELFVSKSL